MRNNMTQKKGIFLLSIITGCHNKYINAWGIYFPMSLLYISFAKKKKHVENVLDYSDCVEFSV